MGTYRYYFFPSDAPVPQGPEKDLFSYVRPRFYESRQDRVILLSYVRPTLLISVRIGA